MSKNEVLICNEGRPPQQLNKVMVFFVTEVIVKIDIARIWNGISSKLMHLVYNNKKFFMLSNSHFHRVSSRS